MTGAAESVDKQERSEASMPVGGNRDAELFGQLYPSLRRFASAIGPRDMSPDDLVQEAVARTLRSRSLSDLDDPATYLRTAIHNIAANERRSLRRRYNAVRRLRSETVQPQYPSDLSELLSVSSTERAALYLHEVEGYSFAEAATVLRSSEEAVRMAASRGRRNLRRLLEDRDE